MRSLYLTNRFFAVLGGLIGAFVLGFFVPAVLVMAQAGLLALGVLGVVDAILLFRTRQGLHGRRATPEKLSNGDENPIFLHLENRYAFPVEAVVVDEVPVQFQVRDAAFSARIPVRGRKTLRYTLRPVRRGSYDFGALNVYVRSPLHLAERRYRFDEAQAVPVYPSFVQLRRYELYAATDRLTEVGVKRVRRLGHTMEFDQLRTYVPGDDQRAVNWKATARRGELIVNQYQDERAQPVYALLDKSRAMQMPFEEMTLLDYSINAALVLLNVALLKHDRAGLITFEKTVETVVPAERRGRQRHLLLEALYNQRTTWAESSFEALYAVVRRQVKQRSLLMLFTHFETRDALHRQLPYLRRLSRDHLLVVIFFVNTELNAVLEQEPDSVEEIYVKAVAEQFAWEQREIVRELERHGIPAILTPPEHLTVEALNKYLELKARGLI